MLPIVLRTAGLCAAIAIVAIGCARTIATSTPYEQLPPKVSAAEVSVFTDAKPDRPYKELGLIEVKKFGVGGGYGQLVLRAREEAAKIGADAIIVTRTPKTTTHTVGTVQKDRRGRNGGIVASSSEDEDPRITVTAVAWKSAPKS
jgi:hypothetical protein